MRLKRRLFFLDGCFQHPVPLEEKSTVNEAVQDDLYNLRHSTAHLMAQAATARFYFRALRAIGE